MKIQDTINRLAPDTVIQLAKGVYLLAGLPEFGQQEDLIILYDSMEWEPASYNVRDPRNVVGAPEHTRALEMSRVSIEYTMVTHVCRVWMDMMPRANAWWYEKPTVHRGEPLNSELPSLKTVLPHHYNGDAVTAD